MNDQLAFPERVYKGHQQWHAEDVIRTMLPARTALGAHVGTFSQYATNNARVAGLPGDQPPNAFLLILTEKDLWSGEPNNFVFGVTNVKLHAGIVSLNRFQAGSAPDAEVVLLRRAIKVAVSLVGQNAGIRDFAGYACCMNRTNNVPELDRNPLAFCPECELKVWWLADSDPLQRYEALKEFAAKHNLREEKAHWESSITAIRSGTEK